MRKGRGKGKAVFKLTLGEYKVNGLGLTLYFSSLFRQTFCDELKIVPLRVIFAQPMRTIQLVSIKFGSKI